VPLLEAIWVLIQDHSSVLLAFVGAALGSIIGPLATTAAARRSAKATLAAADRAAATAEHVAELNERSARELAEINREAQRTIERDRDRRAWRRHFLEPFLEHANQRFRAWLEYTNAVKAKRTERDLRTAAAAALADFLPPTFAWGVVAKSELGVALMNFAGADRALEASVSRVISAISTPGEDEVIAEVSDLATKLSNAFDELAIAVENYIYAERTE
jgi:hypothetical protein